MTVADMNLAKAERGIKGGAHSKVTPELLRKAKAFVEGEWKKYNKTVPTVEMLAKHLNLTRQYLYELPQLSDTLEQVQREQASMLIDRGLTNEYNPAIVKLLLSSKHGYVEKQQTENINVNIESGQAKPELAAGFSDYLKQQTMVKVNDNPVEGEIVDKKE